jgi:hypothetical protein
VKLNGILSAKSKRETWERNNRKPPIEPQPTSPHKPLNGENGTVWCCGSRYTPAAQERHARGERLTTCYADVFAVDSDPWLEAEDARIKAERREPSKEDDAIRRAEQVALYYEQQRRRPSPRNVSTASWLGED